MSRRGSKVGSAPQSTRGETLVECVLLVGLLTIVVIFGFVALG
jgi:hypothetical protein